MALWTRTIATVTVSPHQISQRLLLPERINLTRKKCLNFSNLLALQSIRGYFFYNEMRMRYINLRFAYLLTYLLTYFALSLTYVILNDHELWFCAGMALKCIAWGVGTLISGNLRFEWMFVEFPRWWGVKKERDDSCELRLYQGIAVLLLFSAVPLVTELRSLIVTRLRQNAQLTRCFSAVAELLLCQFCSMHRP